MKYLFTTFNLLLFLLINVWAAQAQINIDTAAAIRLNQLGFFPKENKMAVVENMDRGHFYVVRSNNNDTVFSGQLADPQKDIYSGNIISEADFSAVQSSGDYYLYVPKAGNSSIFSIHKNIYVGVAKGVLKAYYFMRCSETLLPAYAGKWARAEGHPDTVVYVHPSAASADRPAGTIISSPGGWYDAGDYNKYIVNSGIATATLLSAYEDFPHYFDTLTTNIPENGNGIPDILNEVLWNLRWMMTMQDPHDGGVYHKLTNAQFAKFVMPDQARAKRYVVEKSTAATLDFAAVMAQAARIFQKFPKQLPGLSDSCLAAAKFAWQWAQQHLDIIYNQNAMNEKYQPAITTGTYGDWHITDEKYWAAIELFITTGNNEYYHFAQSLPTEKMILPSWSQMHMLGCYSLFRFRHKEKNISQDITSLQQQFLQFADDLLQHKNDAYHTIMGGSPHDYIWGSNAVAANQGIVMINAYLLTRDKKYLREAADNLDYILGRNATGYSFVTGFGTKTPMHPHHRPSQADGVTDPVPGLLVAGPNPGRQDHCASYPTTIPDQAYTDDVCAYACNEIAINWNAPMVYLTNAIENLQSALK